MLTTAPSTTDFMATFAKPWQMINWFIPIESRANMVPSR